MSTEEHLEEEMKEDGFAEIHSGIQEAIRYGATKEEVFATVEEALRTAGVYL